MVGRAVAFITRDLLFESSHSQTYIEHLFTINCVEKTKIKKKDAGNCPFFIKTKQKNQLGRVRERGRMKENRKNK